MGTYRGSLNQKIFLGSHSTNALTGFANHRRSAPKEFWQKLSAPQASSLKISAGETLFSLWCARKSPANAQPSQPSKPVSTIVNVSNHVPPHVNLRHAVLEHITCSVQGLQAVGRKTP